MPPTNFNNQKLTEQIIFPPEANSLYIRKLEHTDADYKAIARCFNSFKDSDSWPDGFHGSFIFTKEWAKETYENRDISAYFVAVDPVNTEKIVGVCLCNKSADVEDSWYVDLLGVDPAYQGKKIGKGLLLRATKFAMENNARFISLHTWGGNIKAMPLYKKQGYKWRPNTFVYMENYIPQILNFPLFRPIFSVYSWYDIFKPHITQEVDEEFEEQMAVYSYYFEKENELKLTVWIDRTIGKISGFHLITKDKEIKIKASTSSSKRFIGLATFPVKLLVEAQTKEEEEYNVSVNITGDVKLKQKNDSNKLNGKDSTLIEWEGFFDSNSHEFDFDKFPQSYSPHGITFNIKAGKERFNLHLGLIPIYALKVQTEPLNLAVMNKKGERIVNLIIKNYTGEDQEVIIDLEDGKYTRFCMHHYQEKVSKYDHMIKVPAKFDSPETAVDYFNVKIKNNDNKSLINAKLPVIIFHNSMAVTYNFNKTIYIENKYVRLTIEEEPFDENNIKIEDKTSDLFVSGGFLLLGMPFDVEGSEFYSAKLEHNIVQDKRGIILITKGISKEKKGIVITRKVVVPNDNEPIAINFEVTNLNEEEWDDIGVKYVFQHWEMQAGKNYTVLPLKEGILYNNLEPLALRLGNSPKELNEGWFARIYGKKYFGIVFELDKVYNISLDESLPDIDFHVDTIKRKETYAFPAIYLMFNNDWKEIRRKWNELFNKEELIEQELQEMRKIGFSSSQDSEIHRGVIIPKNYKKVFVALDTFRETTLKGIIRLKNDNKKEIILPHTIVICGLKTQRYKKNEIKIKSETNDYFSTGKIIYDTESRIVEVPYSFLYYEDNEKSSVQITKKDQGENSYYEVNNGYLTFRASENFKGGLFYLKVNKDETDTNLLNTFWPKSPPFLWDNRYFGGINSSVRSPGSWSELEFAKTKFSTISPVEKGKFRGVSFNSEILTKPADVKGLQVTNSFLTLPSTPIIVVQHEIINISNSIKYFDFYVSADLKTSKTIDDEYYVVDDNNNIIKYHAQDEESDVWKNQSLHAKFAAIKIKGTDHYFGATIDTNVNNQSVNVYSPNMSLISIIHSAKKVKIAPQQKITFNTIYLLTDKLEAIEPFTDSNIKELLASNK